MARPNRIFASGLAIALAATGLVTVNQVAAAAPYESATASPSASASASSTPPGNTSASTVLSNRGPQGAVSCSRTDAASAAKAADYLAKFDPSANNVGLATEVAMALVAQGSPQANQLVTWLGSHSAGYATSDPIAAAKVAILVAAVGQNPSNFDGVNLVQEINKGTLSDGQVGSFGYAFGQAMAIIALERAGADVPTNLITNLLTYQGPNGGFGYDYKGTFYVDPDATALALMAMKAVEPLDSAIPAASKKAIAWAHVTVQDGGWLQDSSPTNSTGIMAAALDDWGVDISASITWLTAHQLASGAWSNTIDGTNSDDMATGQAILGVSGVSYATLGLRVTPCGSSPAPSVPASAVSAAQSVSVPATPPAHPLPATGSEESVLPALVVALAAVGAAAGAYVRAGKK